MASISKDGFATKKIKYVIDTFIQSKAPIQRYERDGTFWKVASFQLNNNRHSIKVKHFKTIAKKGAIISET